MNITLKATSLKSGAKNSINTDKSPAILIAVEQKSKLSKKDFDLGLSPQISQQLLTLAQQQQFTGKKGSTVHLPCTLQDGNKQATLVCLVGTGDQKKTHITTKADAIAQALRTINKQYRATAASIYVDLLNEKTDELVKAIAACSVQRLYQFNQFKSKNITKNALQKIAIASEQANNSASKKTLTLALQQGIAIGAGCNHARDLGNMPGNECTPQYLSKLAKSLATKNTRLKTSVLGEAQMKKLGMGSFLSVSRGSAREGQMICMQYKGAAKASDKPVVLIGKGITFDTGGISLKGGAGMDEMKFDMCGAASVMGTMQAVLELQLPINVTAIVAAAENMPGSQASRPGDIVTTMSGQTVEILNTDAEGRLVLCDALTYAAQFKPAAMIDIATLTGACVVALGAHASAVYSNNDALSQQLISAGKNSHDRAWPMPLWDDYQPQIDSAYADMANIGGPKAGSITAACFLKRFVDDATPWAHMDIAGSAWHSNGPDKGATGRPVTLLTQYLLDYCAAQKPSKKAKK